MNRPTPKPSIVLEYPIDVDVQEVYAYLNCNNRTISFYRDDEIKLNFNIQKPIQKYYQQKSSTKLPVKKVFDLIDDVKISLNETKTEYIISIFLNI